MTRWGVLDVPGHRSAHVRPVPKGGGIGIMAGWGAATLLLRIAVPGMADGLGAFSVLGAAIGLSAFSWADDVRPYEARAKLVMQLACAVIVVWGALGRLSADWPAIGMLAPVLGVFWLLLATNAVNFIDGINGLASGSLLLVGVALYLHAPVPGLLPLIVLAAALLAFLPFNYPRARIFMGDVGSQGAALVVAGGCLWTGDLFGLCLLFGIIFDVVVTLGRRALARRRLMEAHRGHLYQLAHRMGAPAWAITLLYWGFVAWGGVAGSVILQEAGLPAAMTALIAPQIVWMSVVWGLARSRVRQPW